eukprot:1158572-Pelagomonas_calceolata.AAC.5
MSINGVPAISELSPLHAARAWSASDARLPISVTTMDGPILTEYVEPSQEQKGRKGETPGDALPDAVALPDACGTQKRI